MLFLRHDDEIIGEIEGRLDEAISSRVCQAALSRGAGVELVTNGGRVVAETRAVRTPAGEQVLWELLVEVAPAMSARGEWEFLSVA